MTDEEREHYKVLLAQVRLGIFYNELYLGLTLIEI